MRFALLLRVRTNAGLLFSVLIRVRKPHVKVLPQVWRGHLLGTRHANGK